VSSRLIGRATSLPGLSLRYERPSAPELIARGGRDNATLDRLIARITTVARPAPPASQPTPLSQQRLSDRSRHQPWKRPAHHLRVGSDRHPPPVREAPRGVPHLQAAARTNEVETGRESGEGSTVSDGVVTLEGEVERAIRNLADAGPSMRTHADPISISNPRKTPKAYFLKWTTP